MRKLMFIPFQHSLISMGSDGQTAPHNAYKLDNVWSAQVELSGSKVTHSVKKTLLGFIAKTTGGNMTSTHIHICFHLLLPTQSAVSTRDTKIIWNTKGGGRGERNNRSENNNEEFFLVPCKQGIAETNCLSKQRNW